MDERAVAALEGRAEAEKGMTERCRIERPGQTTSDDEGRRTTEYALVYGPADFATAQPDEGRCYLQTHEPHESVRDVVGTTVTTQRYRLMLPADSQVLRVGDRVTMESGRIFRVSGTSAKTYMTAQRVPVDEQTGGAVR